MLNPILLYSLFLESHLPTLVLIIVGLPLLSAFSITLLHKKSHFGWLISLIGLLQILLCICTLIFTYQGSMFHSFLPWLHLQQNAIIPIGIYIDFLTALMLAMISLISWLISLYSIGYLKDNPDKKRYFMLLALFTSTLSWVIVADNLWGMLIGWELVGLLSSLLIGFWHQKTSAIKASIYAWFTSKVGSISFLIGILLIISQLGDCNLPTIMQTTLPKFDAPTWIYVAGACLLIAAFTKSAQFPFFSWLPEAMAAPTPISALLHGATILSLGIYLLIRIQSIFPQELNNILIISGYITAFMGACSAFMQQSIKRMLAYSTISQLGYVIASIGLQVLEAGIVFLLVHAFTKACLFLCAGMAEEPIQQQKFNNIKALEISPIVKTFYAPLLITISYIVAIGGLVGLPGLTGFIAKETILEKTLMWSKVYTQSGYYIVYLVPLLGFVSTFLTILYLGKSFVLLFLQNSGQKVNTGSVIKHLPLSNHSKLMTASILAFVSCIIILSMPITNQLIVNGLKKINQAYIYNLIPATDPTIHHLTIILSIVILLFAMLLLAIKFRKSVRFNLLPYSNKLVRLFVQGWYLDKLTKLITKQVLLYSKLITTVENQIISRLINYLGIFYIVIAHIVTWADDKLIAGVGTGIAILCRGFSKLYLQLQRSSIQTHLIWTYLGILLILFGWVMYSFF